MLSREGKVPSPLPQKPACSSSDSPTPHRGMEWFHFIKNLRPRSLRVKMTSPQALNSLRSAKSLSPMVLHVHTRFFSVTPQALEGYGQAGTMLPWK